MKNVYIIHGWDGNPEEPMLQWLERSLEEKGYVVLVPAMPDTETPKIDAWVGKINEIAQPDGSIFIGHSIGCQAILRYMEKLPENVKIDEVVFIAPWMELDKQTIKEEGEEIVEIARPWMETSIDFEKVKKHSNKFVAIFSDNDPYVPLEQKELFKKEFNAEVIVEHGMGHFTISDDIRELPSALESILKKDKKQNQPAEG